MQYWVGDGDAMDEQGKGAWKTFPNATVTDGKGGTATLGLGSLPVNTKFVRIWMTRSSDTCDSHGSVDRRNCVGYAIRELYLGTLDEKGDFQRPARPIARSQAHTLSLCSRP